MENEYYIIMLFYYKNIKILFNLSHKYFLKIRVYNIKIKETNPTCFLGANY